MHSLDVYKQVPSKYLLIEYSKQAHKHTYIKEVYLTEQEAHDLNYALAMNKSGKRYVKDVPRKI